MRWKSGLFAASPGTMAFLMASPRTSRRSLALRACSSGPWQVKHRSERIGRMSRLKSTAGSGAASRVDDQRSAASRASRTRVATSADTFDEAKLKATCVSGRTTEKQLILQDRLARCSRENGCETHLDSCRGCAEIGDGNSPTR